MNSRTVTAADLKDAPAMETREVERAPRRPLANRFEAVVAGWLVVEINRQPSRQSFSPSHALRRLPMPIP